MALFEDPFQNMTASGLYRAFGRPTMDIMRRRHRGEDAFDLTPGYMPGNLSLGDRILRGEVEATHLRGDPELTKLQGGAEEFLKGGPMFEENLNPAKYRASFGGFGQGLLESGQRLRAGQEELLQQRLGLVKGIQAAHVGQGLEGSPITGAAMGLGVGVFNEQAAIALGDLIAERNRKQLFMNTMQQSLERSEAWRNRPGPQRMSAVPGRGSLFFSSPTNRGRAGGQALQPRVQPSRT